MKILTVLASFAILAAASPAKDSKSVARILVDPIFIPKLPFDCIAPGLTPYNDEWCRLDQYCTAKDGLVACAVTKFSLFNLRSFGEWIFPEIDPQWICTDEGLRNYPQDRGPGVWCVPKTSVYDRSKVWFTPVIGNEVEKRNFEMSAPWFYNYRDGNWYEIDRSGK